MLISAISPNETAQHVLGLAYEKYVQQRKVKEIWADSWYTPVREEFRTLAGVLEKHHGKQMRGCTEWST